MACYVRDDAAPRLVSGTHSLNTLEVISCDHQSSSDFQVGTSPG